MLGYSSYLAHNKIPNEILIDHLYKDLRLLKNNFFTRAYGSVLEIN